MGSDQGDLGGLELRFEAVHCLIVELKERALNLSTVIWAYRTANKASQ